MKKIVLISSIVLSSVAMMNAQTKQTAAPVKNEVAAKPTLMPEARAKERVAEINSLCQLKPEQTTKVNNLYVDFFKKQDALKAKQASLSGEEFTKQMAALKTERDASLKATLTPQQIASLEKSRK